MQTHLCTHAWQRLGEKVRMPHPRLQRAKRVLDRRSAYAHHVGVLVETRLSRFDHGFVFPSTDRRWSLGVNFDLIGQRTQV